jgi:biopolymer transport protein ExbB/TolQ
MGSVDLIFSRRTRQAKRAAGGGEESMTRTTKVQNQLLPFVFGALFTGLLYFGLNYVNKERYLYLFFFRSWYVQAITTWLFGAAIAFVILRYYRVLDEARILSRKVAVERLDQIRPDSATELLEVIPAKYRDAIGFRRIGELLRGYLHGEEVIRLNQELSRRDVEQIETGHLVLNALRQLIPVLGFLGTVVGLSLGMVQFPDITRTGGNIDALRSVLKDFAASLSVAFDTTLLALGYSVVVVLLTAVLRHKEESFVSEVDHKAQELITKLSPLTEVPVKSQEVTEDLLRKVIEKMDELKEALRRPPNYEIIVQAREDTRHG